MQNLEQTRASSTSAPSSSLTAVTTTGEKTIADGKTAAEIIAEAKAKPKPKLTWKQKFNKGATMAMLGTNN